MQRVCVHVLALTHANQEQRELSFVFILNDVAMSTLLLLLAYTSIGACCLFAWHATKAV